MQTKRVDDVDFPQRDPRVPARFDFLIEKVVTNDETRMAYFALTPDPRRYEEIEIDGEAYFLDKYLRHAISKEEFLTAAVNQSKSLPLFHNPPTIESAAEYAGARRLALSEELQGREYAAPSQRAANQRDLEESEAPRSMSFVSLDICGSSSLRRSNQVGFDRAYSLMLRELATSVGQFHGSILKTTGDGFIAFLDYPGFTTLCDNTIDLGLTLIRVVRDSLNPALKEAGLPELHVRVGAEYGEATIRHITVPATGFTTHEVASDALNRAVKIEQSSLRDEFRIGRNLYELIHVQWLQRCDEVAFESEQVGITGYKVYRVN